MRSSSYSHEKVQLIRSWDKRDRGIKAMKEEGIKSKDETALPPPLCASELKSVVNYCVLLHKTACAHLPKPRQVFLSSPFVCLNVCI